MQKGNLTQALSLFVIQDSVAVQAKRNQKKWRMSGMKYEEKCDFICMKTHGDLQVAISCQLIRKFLMLGEISHIALYFIQNSREISCQVTGKRDSLPRSSTSA